MKAAIGSVLGLAALGVAGDAEAYNINTTDDGEYIRWMKDAVASRADINFQNMLSDGQAMASLAIAFDAWRGYAGVPELLIGEGAVAAPGYHRGKSTNTVHYLKDWPYEDEKLAVTVVTYELNSGKLLDADILVNGGVNYKMLDEGSGDRSAYDLAAVLTHEAGHMLGLGESPDVRDATMYPYARPGDTHQRTIELDDEAGVQLAYNGITLETPMGCGNASVGGSLARRELFGPLAGTFLPVLIAMGAMRSTTSRRSIHPSAPPSPILQPTRHTLIPTLPPGLMRTIYPTVAPTAGSLLASLRPAQAALGSFSIPPLSAVRVPSIAPSLIPGDMRSLIPT